VQRDALVATLAGLVTALAVFAAMFWLVDASEVVAAASRADPVLLAAVTGLILLWNVSWGLALWNVLQALDIEVSLSTALLVNAAGAFANHVTPFGQAGGEPVTAWLLHQTAETEYEVSLASIASLDAINVVPSLTFATAGALYYVTTATAGSGLGLLPVAVLAVAVGLPVAAVVVWRYRGTVSRPLGRTVGALGRRVVEAAPRLSPDAVAERIDGFTDAVTRVAVSRRRLAAAVGCSGLGWAFQAVGLWVTFLALESSIPAYVPFFVLPLGKVGSLLPTPGGLGGTEAINVTLLVLLTGATAPTIAAAVTIHSVGGYILTTGVGAAATSALGVRSM
jgi:uncharacterized protein (TIRG00374 family)